MPFIGAQPATTFAKATSQTFTGDNSDVTFTLNTRVSNPEDLEVFVSNIQQQPTTSYTIDSDGVTLRFSEAPPSGTFYVVYRNLAQQTGTDTGAARLSGNNTLVGDQTITGTLDMNGGELILDADADTSITADTDDQIDFKVNNIDSFLVGQDYVKVKGVHPDLYITDTDDGSNNDAGLFYNNGVLSISADHSNVANNSAMVFFTDGTERARFNTAGNLAFAANKGIDFASASAGTGGNPAETSTATLFNDYEEGTFTPYSNSVTGSNGGNGALVGFYVKVGNLVSCAVRFQADGMSTNGHQFGIYLPFNAHSTTGSGSYNAFTCVPIFYAAANSTGRYRIGAMEGNSNYVEFRTQYDASASSVTGSTMTGTFNMNFSITYRTID